MTTLVDNAADRNQVRRAEKKRRQQRVNELADLRHVLKDAAARRVLWRLLEHCGVFRSIWHPSALIHFNEGKRDTGLFLMRELADAEPNALLTMMAEAGNAKLSAEIERENEKKVAPAAESDGAD